MKLPDPPTSIADREAFTEQVLDWIAELEARVQTTRRQGRARLGLHWEEAITLRDALVLLLREMPSEGSLG